MKARFDEEEFNLRYRLGGGDAREFDFHRDLVSEMRQASHNPFMVWNGLAAMGCPVLGSERIRTGCGGLDYHG